MTPVHLALPSPAGSTGLRAGIWAEDELLAGACATGAELLVVFAPLLAQAASASTATVPSTATWITGLLRTVLPLI